MEQLGTVETICRYPVKSMAGEAVDEAFVGYGGIMGDRVYAFVHPGGRQGFPWHTGRDQEDLVLYRPRFCQPAAASLPVDIATSLALGPGINPIFPPPDSFAVMVTTPVGSELAVDSAELAA